MTKIFQVDAFTDHLFGGNPAAVVPLESWLDDKILQAVAMENNLAETAFIVRAGDAYELRWFTPTSEVALCGHATLATAYVLVHHLGATAKEINFITRQSGTLSVRLLESGQLAMSFPSIPVVENADFDLVTAALGSRPVSLYCGYYAADEFDYMAIFETAEQVAALVPDNSEFTALCSRGVIASAVGRNCDFVSRYFAPNFGIDEDPVTGSAHCLLAPYWAEKLGKKNLAALQISSRGGKLDCNVESTTTVLTGSCVDYLQGEIKLS